MTNTDMSADQEYEYYERAETKCPNTRQFAAAHGCLIASPCVYGPNYSSASAKPPSTTTAVDAKSQ